MTAERDLEREALQHAFAATGATEPGEDAAGVGVEELPVATGDAGAGEDTLQEQVAADIEDAAVHIDENTGGDPAQDLTPGELYAAVARMLEGLAQLADEVADVATILEPERRRVIVERAAGSIQAQARHVAAILMAWLDEPDFVTPDVPNSVMSVLEEDPGDLTCPRCDRPITLMELRAVGICNRCETANIPGPQVGPGDGDSDPGDDDRTLGKADGDDVVRAESQ